MSPYCGRFAPTPNGDLHFGSLLTAMASYADARKNQGQWLIRFDDIDRPRVVKNSDKSILSSLEQLGFQWDKSVLYQSDNIDIYEDTLNKLQSKQLSYYCYCSRRRIFKNNPSGIYPGTCRYLQEKPAGINKTPSVRINTGTHSIAFTDRIQGQQNCNFQQQFGDFIIRRADHIFSYFLCFAIDCELDGISTILRGCDLLTATAPQIFLQQTLAFRIPRYIHIPIITDKSGRKLGKSTRAEKVQTGVANLIKAADYLGQTIPKELHHASITEFWNYLLNNWDIDKIPRTDAIIMDA